MKPNEVIPFKDAPKLMKELMKTPNTPHIQTLYIWRRGLMIGKKKVRLKVTPTGIRSVGITRADAAAFVEEMMNARMEAVNGTN